MKLSERLRCAVDDFPSISENPAVLMTEAADYIESLERQNAMLLEALKDTTSALNECCGITFNKLAVYDKASAAIKSVEGGK